MNICEACGVVVYGPINCVEATLELLEVLGVKGTELGPLLICERCSYQVPQNMRIDRVKS